MHEMLQKKRDATAMVKHGQTQQNAKTLCEWPLDSRQDSRCHLSHTKLYTEYHLQSNLKRLPHLHRHCIYFIMEMHDHRNNNERQK